MPNVTRRPLPRDPEHLTDDRAGHALLQDHVVSIEEPVDRLLDFGTEVGRQKPVELPGRVLANTRRAGKPHRVMNDVVGIHGDRSLDISGTLGLEVLLDQGNRLLLAHPCPFPVAASLKRLA